MTYTQTYNAENQLVSITANPSGQTTTFVYDGDGNLVKKIKPDGSKTLYVGGVYEVDKSSGGSTVRTLTYYPMVGVPPPSCGHLPLTPLGYDVPRIRRTPKKFIRT